MAAGKAHSQVDPGVADLQAFLAAIPARSDVSNLFDVGAGWWGMTHGCTSFYLRLCQAEALSLAGSPLVKASREVTSSVRS